MGLVFETNKFCALIQQFAVISQVTATSDIVSMCMDFDNDQPGDNRISESFIT